MQPSARLLTLTLLAPAWVLTAQTAGAGEIVGAVRTPEGGLEDAVVYVENIAGMAFSPPESALTLDQRDLKFIPHVLPVLAGTKVTFPNSDVTRHSVFSPSRGREFDLGTYPADSVKEVRFDEPGVTVLLCHIHPEMSAFIVVLKTPYFSKSDGDGGYRIPGVPVGRYRLAVWHEWAQPSTQEVEVPADGVFTVDWMLRD